MKKETQKRIMQFRSLLKQKKIDMAMFFNFTPLGINENTYYLTGYEGLGILVVSAHTMPFLVAPALDLEKAKETGIRSYRWEKGVKVFELITEIIKNRGIDSKIKTIGIDFEKTSLRVFKNIEKIRRGRKTEDIGEIILDFRAVKDEDEQKILRKSCNIACEILEECIQGIMKGKLKTEKEVSSFLKFLANNEADGVSFEPIVASGSNGAKPHHTPSDTNLKKGFCVIDFGVKYCGYCSDITRTIYLGRPSISEIAEYTKLLGVQKEAISLCGEGVACSRVYDYAYDMLGEVFNHGLGHGIGVEIHEKPNIKGNSPDVFKKGMIFTIEPGVYYPNRFGIRIEDDLIIGKDGKAEVLTKISKNLRILPKLFK